MKTGILSHSLTYFVTLVGIFGDSYFSHLYSAQILNHDHLHIITLDQNLNIIQIGLIFVMVAIILIHSNSSLSFRFLRFVFLLSWNKPTEIKRIQNPVINNNIISIQPSFFSSSYSV